MARRTRRARLLTGAVASHAVSVPAAVDVHQIRATPALLNQTQACLDEHSSRGRWQGETWQGSPSARCGYGQLAPGSARERLRGQHVVVVGDLAARLWYTARPLCSMRKRESTIVRSLSCLLSQGKSAARSRRASVPRTIAHDTCSLHPGQVRGAPVLAQWHLGAGRGQGQG